MLEVVLSVASILWLAMLAVAGVLILIDLFFN